MTEKFKWASPYEWLADKTKDANETTIRQDMLAFALLVGNDEIQEMYQSEMDKDGYFEPLPSPPPQDVVDRAKAIARAITLFFHDEWVPFDPNWELQLTRESADDPIEATLYRTMEDGTPDTLTPYPVGGIEEEPETCPVCDGLGLVLCNDNPTLTLEIHSCDNCAVLRTDAQATTRAYELAKAALEAGIKLEETP